MAALTQSARALVAAPGARVARPARRSVAVKAGLISVESFSKDDVIVSPSILSANFAKLGEQVRCWRG